LPGVGFLFDLTNAGIYAARGMTAEAVISTVAAIPGAGDVVAAGLKGGSLLPQIGTGVKAVARAVGTGVGSNALEQGARMYYGKQEGFHWEQTLGAAVGGAALGRLTVGAGRAVEASRNVLARTAILTAGSGAAALLGDGATQAGAIYAGRQERFDLFQSATAFAGGALGGLVGSVAGAFDKTCFRAGTPLVCEGGHRPVEDLRKGDKLAARDEFDPDGPIEFKAIEEVFVRRGLILEVTVAGQTIGTTAEHPFYVFERVWTPAGELQVGDLLATAAGRYLPVEKLHHTGNLETVYNFRVADHHTYFVADQHWGFEVWVHNRSCTPTQQLSQAPAQARRSLRNSMNGIRDTQEAHHVIPFELKDHDLIVYAASRGWNINRGASNGVALGNRTSPMIQHNGSHPRYKNAVEAKLDSIMRRNGGLNDATFAEFSDYVSAMQRALPRIKTKLS
jgi:hypothetical protein